MTTESADADERPFFSVIVPTYNRLQLLKQAIASVLCQTTQDFELIVVDDGSQDGTGEYVNALAAKVRLVTQANRGPGAARNKGIHEARGTYLAFLDSDDVWLPWALEVFADVIARHGSPVIVASRLVRFAGTAELDVLARENVRTRYFADYFGSSSQDYYVGAGMAVLRRDVVLGCGGFREARENGEDHDLILRLGCERGFAQILSPVTLGWRQHSSSETGNVSRSADGISYIVEQEQRARYPGGAGRAMERRRIISRYVRSTALSCARHGEVAAAFRLYLRTFAWHVRLGRWRYLLAFPAIALTALIRGVHKSIPGSSNRQRLERTRTDVAQPRAAAKKNGA